MGARAHSTRGSVLLPAVAAMLVLLLTGVALSEIFGAQRMREVNALQSAQAFWIAEAGVWHAAHNLAALSTPVSFGGGSYTVTKSGSTYTSTGTIGAATRVVTLTLVLP
jgi:hypothetical protein